MKKLFHLYLGLVSASLFSVPLKSVRIDDPLVGSALQTELTQFLDREIDEDLLHEMKETILRYYMREKNAFVSVQIPEQNISAGQVEFVVIPAKLESIQVSGNRWFSSNSIRRSMKLVPGQTIDEQTLGDSAAWINRNPFLHTDVILSPGVQAGTSQVEVVAKDKFPLRIYGGVDNTGNGFSGNNRFFTGFNSSLGIHALLSYQFTFGSDFPEFLSHMANFTYYLASRNELTFYGGYSTVQPQISNFSSKGKDIQASMRRTFPFQPLFSSLTHQFTWGADYKFSNSDLFFVGSIAKQKVNRKIATLFQFCFIHQLEKEWKSWSLNSRIDFYVSPFEFLPHQSTGDYNGLRPHAKTRYFYSRLSLGTLWDLPKQFTSSLLLRGQISTSALLPSEQYGLGGHDTVRGYQERIYLADNMVLANLEFRTPEFSFTKTKKDKLSFLTFFDGAWGKNWSPSTAFVPNQWLSSAGAGVRYNIPPNVAFRLDYGFKFTTVHFANDQIGRAHFSLVCSF